MSATTNLPEWIQSLSKESSASSANFTPRLVQAISIMWEALEKVRDSAIVRSPHHEPSAEDYKAMWRKDCEFAKEAMRRVEELGK